MRHGVFGRGLSRTTSERRRLFMGLVREMIARGQVKTTLGKAKAVQSLMERLVTKAKDGSEHSRRRALRVIADRQLTAELFSAAKTQFANRTSGFTRIVKLGPRRGDATEEALLTFVDQKVVAEVVKPVKKETTDKSKAPKVAVTSSKTPTRPKKVTKK